MTLKQAKLLKNLPTSKSIMDAAIKAGYSPTARQMYDKGVMTQIATYIANDPDKIKAELEQALSECKQNNDMTSRVRILESLARINAMFKDKAEITTKNDVDTQLPTEELLKDIDHIKSRISQKVENKPC